MERIPDPKIGALRSMETFAFFSFNAEGPKQAQFRQSVVLVVRQIFGAGERLVYVETSFLGVINAPAVRYVGSKNRLSPDVYQVPAKIDYDWNVLIGSSS